MERPPAASEPLEAIVLDDAPAAAPGPGSQPAAVAVAAPPAPSFPLPIAPTVQFIPKPVAPPPSTAQIVEARRKALVAMGGTVGALVLGVFALAIAPFRFEAAIVGLIGIGLGVWGLYSPRRNWAFVGVLICCLAIGLGAYRGASDLYRHIKNQQPLEIEQPAEEDVGAP